MTQEELGGADTHATKSGVCHGAFAIEGALLLASAI